MREWLPAGHVVWLVIDAVRRLDTSAFHARRRTGGAGAAGYDPDMMVTLLVWAYANGITSLRRIERLCQQDVAFRVICAGRAPDHVTVARAEAVASGHRRAGGTRPSRRRSTAGVREVRAELERPAAAGAKNRKKRREAAQRNVTRPGLAPDARAGRRVPAGVQPAERHQ